MAMNQCLIVDRRVWHYFMFGPFGLLMLLYDILLWLTSFCCKRKRVQYTPTLGDDTHRRYPEINQDPLEASSNGVEINLI